MKSGRDVLIGGIALISQIVFLLFVGIFVCVFVYCCAFYIAPEIWQRIRLARFEDEFGRLQHPTDTSLIERRKEFLPYASNDCAYFVGELREYDGERQEIIEFYIKQDREEPFSEHLYLLFVEEGKLPDESVSLRRESRWDFGPIVRPDYIGLSGVAPFPPDLDENQYIVFLAHVERFYFDHRCH